MKIKTKTLRLFVNTDRIEIRIDEGISKAVPITGDPTEKDFDRARKILFNEAWFLAEMGYEIILNPYHN